MARGCARLARHPERPGRTARVRPGRSASSWGRVLGVGVVGVAASGARRRGVGVARPGRRLRKLPRRAVGAVAGRGLPARPLKPMRLGPGVWGLGLGLGLGPGPAAGCPTSCIFCGGWHRVRRVPSRVAGGIFCVVWHRVRRVASFAPMASLRRVASFVAGGIFSGGWQHSRPMASACGCHSPRMMPLAANGAAGGARPRGAGRGRGRGCEHAQVRGCAGAGARRCGRAPGRARAGAGARRCGRAPGRTRTDASPRRCDRAQPRAVQPRGAGRSKAAVPRGTTKTRQAAAMSADAEHTTHTVR